MTDPFDDARALAQHSAALRRLACGLVSDPNTADDLVQDTWLGALSRLRRRGEATGPGGLRLGVRHRAISGRRRRAAEALGDADAELSAGGDPAESAARLERYRILHEELTGLREPYRRTLVARFVEEERHAAIAKAEGISVATVRTRITRGLALLRERLDRRFDDGDGRGRAAWMAALGPLARPERAAAGVGAGALLTAAAVLVALGSLTALAAIGEGEPARTAPLPSRAVADADANPGRDGLVAPAANPHAARAAGGPAESVTEEPTSADPNAAPAEDPEPLTISGIAVDQDGAPLEGVAYEAVPPPGNALLSSPGQRLPRTDSRGRFEVEFSPMETAASVHNVVFADARSVRGTRARSTVLRHLGVLERARAGSSGHVVELHIDRRQPGRVIGVVPDLVPKGTVDVDPGTYLVSLSSDPIAYRSRVRYSTEEPERGAAFAIEDVHPGEYSLLVWAMGQRPIFHGGVVVRPGETTEIPPLTYASVGTVLFERVRLLPTDGSRPEPIGQDLGSAIRRGELSGPTDDPDERPRGIGGWISSDAGFSGAVSVRFGDDIPLMGDAPELCAGEWTIRWDDEGLVAPTTRLVVRPGAVTRLRLDVRRTREIDVSVIPPEDDPAMGPAWGAVTCTMLDERGREILAEHPVVRRVGAETGAAGARLARIPVPIGGRVIAVFETDGGHESRLSIVESEVSGAPSPLQVDLR